MCHASAFHTCSRAERIPLAIHIAWRMCACVHPFMTYRHRLCKTCTRTPTHGTATPHALIAQCACYPSNVSYPARGACYTYSAMRLLSIMTSLQTIAQSRWSNSSFRDSAWRLHVSRQALAMAIEMAYRRWLSGVKIQIVNNC